MTCYKKISLAVVEGDYALSVHNCQADAIPAAQSVVEKGWVAGGGRREVLRALQPGWPRCGEEGCRGCLRTLYLSFQKHKGGESTGAVEVT